MRHRSLFALLRRFTVPGLLILAAASPVQAECPWTPEPVMSLHAMEFISLAAEAAGDKSAANVLLSYQVEVHCGDADAIAALKPFLKQPDTALPAAAMLVDAGQLEGIELLDAIERASVPLERKAGLLETAARWPALQKSQASTATIVRRTEWAVASGDEKLAGVARELRAMFGDDTSIAARADRLMACAERPDGDIDSDCLGMHELHTAPFSAIESRWEAASPAQRHWLTLWARPTEDNQAFLLAQLPSQDSKLQYQILTEAMEGGETREYAVKAALALIHQAATDFSRRPRNVPIDFGKDYREGMFGIAAYESGEDYPMALQAAFDELTTYPYEDAADAMHSLVQLDHPWLSTQAGIWLVRHGQMGVGENPLGFTFENDGVPAKSVLARIHPVDTQDIPPYTFELFLATIQVGGLGKWEAFAQEPFDALRENPGVIEAIMARIADLPSRIALDGIDITLDEGFGERMDTQHGFKDELDALEWAVKASKDHQTLADRYIHAFAANKAPLWQVFAMAAAMDFGRKDVAQRIAQDFIDSPAPQLGATAREILGLDK